MFRTILILFSVSAAHLFGSQVTSRSLYDLGDFQRPVSTASAEAQLWFNRGLALCYAFNHEEAIRCFEAATKADPNCAMAWWGIAYASGPNINNTQMDDAAVIRAHGNLLKAASLKSQASPVERALIEALSLRYAETAPADRRPFEQAYADAMRNVARNHPQDSDVAALFAESLMLLNPWKHWSPAGEMAPGTAEIVTTLEASLKKWPAHPALCHFYIHTMEASPFPEKALPAANRLREAMPGAGHLVHMPSHIDVLIGDYQAAIIANQKAIAADKAFLKLRGANNFFTLYRIHNYHFIVYAAMFDGQSTLAQTTAEALVAQIPEPMLTDMADFVEAFMPTPLHVMVRYGQWQKILAQPRPGEDRYVSLTVWHYARAIALATLGRLKEAEAENVAFKKAWANIPETRYLFNNSAASILQVAEAMIDGEIAYRHGQFERAFQHLREAVRRDDNLNYDEPWGWMQPARHALGALLLEQGHLVEAESVYRADLKRHPKNIWSLHGLAECLTRSQKTNEAAEVRQTLEKACIRSDVTLKASCYCRLNTMQ